MQEQLPQMLSVGCADGSGISIMMAITPERVEREKVEFNLLTGVRGE